MVIIPVSLRLWKSRGKMSLHSMAVGICGLAMIVRCVANASHIIKINIISLENDSSEPIEEIVFHFINVSG